MGRSTFAVPGATNWLNREGSAWRCDRLRSPPGSSTESRACRTPSLEAVKDHAADGAADVDVIFCDFMNPSAIPWLKLAGEMTNSSYLQPSSSGSSIATRQHGVDFYQGWIKGRRGKLRAGRNGGQGKPLIAHAEDAAQGYRVGLVVDHEG